MMFTTRSPLKILHIHTLPVATSTQCIRRDDGGYNSIDLTLAALMFISFSLLLSIIQLVSVSGSLSPRNVAAPAKVCSAKFCVADTPMATF